MSAIKCSENKCKYIYIYIYIYIYGTPANLVLHYQTIQKVKIGKCVCCYKTINGVCIVEYCNSKNNNED